MFATFISIPLVVLGFGAPQTTCGLQPMSPSVVEAQTLDAFNQRIDAYMQLHNSVEQKLALQWSFDEAEDMFAAVEAMQAGIRAARADASRGAILTSDVGELIRTRLAAQLAACGHSTEDVLAFINEERSPGAARPKVNKPFPWELGSALWPSFPAVLPALPQELQYRFADRDLVLIDIHADLVVDILENALPAPVHGGHGSHR